MALQERHAAVTSSDILSAHAISSPALAAAAINFAASFHRDARTCCSAHERSQLQKVYRDKILANDKFTANIAAAFLSVLGPNAGRNDAGAERERWGDFDRLAQRGKNMRDRESQRLQHQSGIIAAWGPRCFEYYGWHVLPLPLLRQVHDLAVLIPSWDDAVELLNSRMLVRHELRVLHGNNKALRIGEHSAASKVQDSRSPVERTDIVAALDWARANATSAAARQAVKEAAQGMNGTPINTLGLKRDRYGMVVPSVGPYDPDGNDDNDEDVVDVSPRPAKHIKLSAAEPLRLMFPGSLSHVQACQQRDADGEKASTAPIRSNKLSQSIQPELDTAAESLHTRHIHNEHSNEPLNEVSDCNLFLQTIAVGGGSARGETPDQDVEHAHPEVEITSAISSELGTAHNRTDGIGIGRVVMRRSHCMVREQDKQINEERAGEVQSQRDRRARDLGKGMETDMDVDSQLEEMLDVHALEAQRNHEEISDGEDVVAGVAGPGTPKHRAGEEGGRREKEAENTKTNEEQVQDKAALDQAGNTNTNREVENAGPKAHSQEGALRASRTGTSVERTVELQSTHSIHQRESVNTMAPTLSRSSDSDDSDSLQSPTPLQNLQAHLDIRTHQLTQVLSQLNSTPDVRHYAQLQLDWLSPQRWASVYVEPEYHMGATSSASSDSADIWCLDWDTFHQYADSNHVFRRPVVIKQKFQDSGMYEVDRYVDMLWQRFPEQHIEVQDSITGISRSMSMAEYCSTALTVTEAGTSLSDNTASVSNAVNLRCLARADEPLLTRLERFQLLSTLASRVAGTIGRTEHSPSSNLESLLGFDVLSFADAFSSSHANLFGGSWVRCLDGLKIYAIAADLDAEDWRRFADEGCKWSPRGKGRLIALEEDDVLFIPPGLRAIHASFTPEPCLMEGGMLWDECAIPEILDELLWIARHQAGTVQPVAFQLSSLIDALEQWLNENNHINQSSPSHTAAEERQALKASIQSLRACLSGRLAAFPS
ncbi:hypothetical protein yc1106_06628 [Curvularia clavata]|uniref:Uncharacterized protein n=1 Tax=Curvularia clavata TaxID=95742 RepID=A0A9Q8ZDA6_CURCL|nr:hypothetical protein yc1106_06628 [Curvularia clavata]